MMNRQSYQKKLAGTLHCSKFQEIDGSGDNIVLKILNDLNSALCEMKKNSLLIGKKSKRWFTGAQTAIFLPWQKCTGREVCYTLCSPNLILLLNTLILLMEIIAQKMFS